MPYPQIFLPSITAAAILLCLSSPVFGATIDREASVREAAVWRHPGWLSSEFKFNSDFDIAAGPQVLPKDLPLVGNNVECRMTEADAQHPSSGVTRKFFCQLPAPDGGTRRVKIKYKFSNGEISGELLGTRLLWALGFGADQMFYLDRIGCYGCTEDPFKDRRVDPETLIQPRIFEMVAAENKFAGEEIETVQNEKTHSGWSYKELTAKLSDDPNVQAQQKIHREALRLLTVFLRHADNKPENQRLVCEGKLNSEGGCSGPTVMIIQDLGVSFGKGAISPGHMSKVVFNDWAEAKIWSDPARCIGELGENNVGEMEQPVIQEEGRKFLAKILRGFVDGEEGRRRVEELFKFGRADQRFASIEEWVTVFLRKVDEIEFPLGRGHKDFRCPQ